MKVGYERSFATKDMISVFSLRTFHLYVAMFDITYMWSIYLSWYNTQWVLIPIMHDFLDRWLLLTRSILSLDSYWLSWNHHIECVTVATMTWLSNTEYLCHRWPRIYSVCRNHNPVLFSIMNLFRVCNKSNTTDALRVSLIIFKNLQLECVFHYVNRDELK